MKSRKLPTVQQMLDVLEYINFEICNYWGEPIDRDKFSRKEIMEMPVESAWPVDNTLYLYTMIDMNNSDKFEKYTLNGKELDRQLEQYRSQDLYRVNIDCNYSLAVRGESRNDVIKKVERRFKNVKPRLTRIVGVQKIHKPWRRKNK